MCGRCFGNPVDTKKATSFAAFIDRCREWQQNNQEWSLICDIPDMDRIYTQWSELPKAERMHWIGKYKSCGKSAWEEFGIKRRKFEMKFLDEEMALCMEFPAGNAMTVYRTGTEI